MNTITLDKQAEIKVQIKHTSITSVMTAYMDIVNTRLNIHGVFMFTGKFCDRK